MAFLAGNFCFDTMLSGIHSGIAGIRMEPKPKQAQECAEQHPQTDARGFLGIVFWLEFSICNVRGFCCALDQATLESFTLAFVPIVSVRAVPVLDSSDQFNIPKQVASDPGDLFLKRDLQIARETLT